MRRTLFFFQLSIIIGFVPKISIAQSPYNTSWEKDTYIFGAGSGLALAGFLVDRSVTPFTVDEIQKLDRNSVNSFDRSATYNYSESSDALSDIFRNAIAVAPFALFIDDNIRDDWKVVTLMYVEALAFTGGANLLTKGLVTRTRPYVYNYDAPISKKLSSDARKSFYSGHTTIAFASAVFISTVYSDYYPNSDWKPYVWAGTLLTASFVGYLRYDAGMHYPTDIITAAIVGGAIGYLVPWMHRNEKSNLTFLPNGGRAHYGFSIQLRM